MKMTLWASAAFAVAIAMATQVKAQSNNCFERDVILSALAEQYGETRVAIALDNGLQVVELFSSEANNTWSLTVTLSNGVTCLVASGTDLELMPNV